MTIRYFWWGAEERAEKINQSVALCERKYPKIKVKTDFRTCQSFWEKFQTRAVGGNPLDVFQDAVTFLRKYDKRGILLDLTSQVRAGNLSPGHFREGVTKVGVPVGSESSPTTPPCTASPPSRTWPCSATGCRPDREWGSAAARAAALAPPG